MCQSPSGEIGILVQEFQQPNVESFMDQNRENSEYIQRQIANIVKCVYICEVVTLCYMLSEYDNYIYIVNICSSLICMISTLHKTKFYQLILQGLKICYAEYYVIAHDMYMDIIWITYSIFNIIILFLLLKFITMYNEQ